MVSMTFIWWIYHFWARFWPYFNFVDFRAYFAPFSLVNRGQFSNADAGAWNSFLRLGIIFYGKLMYKDTKFCYSSFDISTFGFKAPPYWTDISSKSHTRKEIVGNLIWSLQVWWEDHKGSELLSFWIDHIFNPGVSFVAICAPFLIFRFVTYEESQGRIFFLRWDFLMTPAVSLTDSFLFTVTAPSLDLAFQVPFITHTRPSLSPRSFLLDQIRKLRRLSEYKKYKVDHQ